MRIVDLRPWPVRLWAGRGGGPGPGADAVSRLTGAVADALVARRVAGAGAGAGGPAGGVGGQPGLRGHGQDAGDGGPGHRLGGGRAPGRRADPGLRLAPSATPSWWTPDASGAGDEARLLARILAPPGWPVMQARDRRRGLGAAGRRLPQGAVVLLEDGHQTAGAGRDLDVLILDRWDAGRCPSTEDASWSPDAGPVVPLGPWRESRQGARRAGIWLVEDDDPPAVGAGGRRRGGIPPGTGPGATRRDAPRRGPPTVVGPRFRASRGRSGSRRRGRPAGRCRRALAVRCADHAPYGAGAAGAGRRGRARGRGRPLIGDHGEGLDQAGGALARGPAPGGGARWRCGGQAHGRSPTWSGSASWLGPDDPVR